MNENRYASNGALVQLTANTPSLMYSYQPGYHHLVPPKQKQPYVALNTHVQKCCSFCKDYDEGCSVKCNPSC